MGHLPHIEMFLRALRISRERLDGRSKIAIDARLLRRMLQALAEAAPFSESFYLASNPDIAAAHAAGDVDDLRAHFVGHGYFEGRAGAAPVVDEAYYARTYPDVAEAVRRGDVESAAAHYVRSGAAEGRLPSAGVVEEVESWGAVLHGETRR